MKWVFKVLAISLVLQGFQCSDSNNTSGLITSTQLETKKQEIQNYINSSSCYENLGCGYIAFGSKPCGGPWSYLVFSNSVNLDKLKEMVLNYNEMNRLYNIQTNAMSDCMAITPPTEVKCVNGVCTVIK
ncbi:hypothetical protein [uncultured Flavobacterium sp.]|jgi:hypothetical protein|uniref:hypothetical protein n=1 Tax=uncultured Flavobacterium sp. TaxID=165435 RepID=UPI0030CA1C7D